MDKIHNLTIPYIINQIPFAINDNIIMDTAAIATFINMSASLLLSKIQSRNDNAPNNIITKAIVTTRGVINHHIFTLPIILFYITD